jgi:DNA-directed RNA polymerase sigma subunit (sigma70/sigma32)
MPNQTVNYFLKVIRWSKRLNPKEEDILVKRLRKKKLRQIGKKYHVSDERIRQIENSALHKLSEKNFQERLF